MHSGRRLSRRRFLAAAAATAGALALPRARAAATAEASVSFFLVGDTHYCADKNAPTQMSAVSAAYNRGLVDWLNRLPGTEIPANAGGGTVGKLHGVIHAGDVIDNGDKASPTFNKMAETETAAWLADYGLNGGDGRLRWAVREVHGNHDSPRGDGPVIAEIKARNQRRKGLTNISANGLHYSWDWGGVHFVALGIVVGDAPEVTRKRRYAPLGSLPFLRDDLAEHVGRSRRPVVLVHHVDAHRYSRILPDEVVKNSEWDYGDARAFHETLRPYRVAATLCGHTHVRNILRWDGTENQRTTTGVPFLNTDNAAHFSGPAQAFLHIEITARELRVREFFTKDGWQTGAWTPQSWSFPLA
jgi:Calcineurin-like phosphoesterase